MKLTVIYKKVFDIEKEVNEFLTNLPNKDIHQIDVVCFPETPRMDEDWVAVFIWTKA